MCFACGGILDFKLKYLVFFYLELRTHTVYLCEYQYEVGFPRYSPYHKQAVTSLQLNLEMVRPFVFQRIPVVLIGIYLRNLLVVDGSRNRGLKCLK